MVVITEVITEVAIQSSLITEIASIITIATETDQRVFLITGPGAVTAMDQAHPTGLGAALLHLPVRQIRRPGEEPAFPLQTGRALPGRTVSLLPHQTGRDHHQTGNPLLTVLVQEEVGAPWVAAVVVQWEAVAAAEDADTVRSMI